MSAVVVITPLIIAGWPTITATVMAALGTMGYAVAKDTSSRRQVMTDGKVKAEIEVEDSEILEGTGGYGEELVLEKAGLRATFSRDARGALKVCMEGEGHTKAELKKLGKELIDQVTQQYVYHRVVTELKQRNMAVVDEDVTEDRTIRIRVRNM
jgi:hypothetical protein